MKRASRRSPRRSWYDDLLVEYEGSKRPIPTSVPNLSTTGMFICTPEYFPEGAVLKIRFRLLQMGVLVVTRAEVRHCLTGVGIGVEFIDILDEHREAIAREIADALPHQPLLAAHAVLN